MPELRELVRAAVGAAEAAEQVEAYAEESRHTEVKALRGEVEGMTFAESRGVGVRLISDGRLGYAWAADPSLAEVVETVARARDNAALAEPDEHNALPEAEAATPLPELFDASSAATPVEEKVRLALELERYAVSRDPRVSKLDLAQVGDAVGTVAIASTTGVDAEYARTDAWVVVVTLAVSGEETQTGFSYAIERGLDRLSWQPIADEAVDRGVQMLGAVKPSTAKLPVVLDPFAASSFLGVLAGTLNAENVLKGRSLFAGMTGTAVGSEVVTLVDDGRRPDGPGSCPFDDEGVPSGRIELLSSGTLTGFLHDTYTARRTGGVTALHRQREAGRLPFDAGRRHVELLLRGGRAVVRRAPGEGRGRGADHGRDGRPFGREPDQRRVQRGRHRQADRGRGARRAAPRDDDRLDASRDAPVGRRRRQRPPVLLQRRDAVAVDRGDDAGRRLIQIVAERTPVAISASTSAATARR